MEDYYEYLDSNGVTTLYKLIKDDTVALIDSYSVTINGITTNLDNHVNNADIHTPIATIEGMIDTAMGSLNYATPDYVDTKVADLVNSAPGTLDTLKELSDALGNDSNFATTVVNQIGTKADKDSVYTKGETDTLLEGKANSVHSHVVSDITDFPTIPTKTSQLINDSGFLTSSNGLITSVSWSDIKDKPNFSTVATSGSYTDLSNTPTIPTKVSQLENDMGFGTGGDTSDCVHKTGNETISGSKTFINQVYLGGGGTSYGLISAKDTNSILRLFGGTSPSTGANLDLYGEGLGDGGFSLRARTSDKIVSLDGKTDGTLKWNGKNVALDENLVHTSGDETINGIKTFNNHTIFTQDIFLKDNDIDLTATPTRNTYTTFTFKDKNNEITSFLQYCKQTSGNSYIGLNVRDKNSNTCGIQINTNKEFVPLGNNSYSLGSANYKWAKVYSDDVVHRSGNETIDGVKTFTARVNIKNSDIDLKITPTSNKYSQSPFIDKNDKLLSIVQYAQRSTDVNDLDLYVYDKNSTAHGIQITTNNELNPIGNNYSLGSSSAKWANVYATTYYGNLVGGLTLNQSSLKMTVKDSNSETTRTNDVILANSSNTAYGINVAFGGSSNTVVGAGESYTAQLNELAGNSAENLFLIADNNIYFKPGANTFANAKTVTLSSSAELSGLSKVTSTSFVGALTGNVTGNCSGSSGSCTGNAASATKASYLDNYSLPGGNKIYLDWDKQVKGYVGLKVDKTNMGGLITTKNIGSYINSGGGSGNNTIGSSVSAYWSTSSKVTDTKQASNERDYPECYSSYINRTPSVGIIYSGAQLYTSLDVSANATGELGGTVQDRRYITKVTAQATFSNPISSTGKYLCTTANTVSFRAYTPGGKSRPGASVIDNTSTKSIFIRVE